MNADIKSPPFQFQLSEGYRAARRMNSFFCAIALAWSAAQFDLKNLSIGYIGNIDLSRASIPLILACVIAYSTVRFTLEFKMQSVEVRRWGYAQTDFKISIYLVRFTILILAASGLSRSVNTIIYVLLAAVGVFLLFFIFLFVGTIVLSFFFITLRNLRGYHSAAAGAGESLAWAHLVSMCFLSVGFLALGIASLQYEPLLSLWTTPPSPIAVGVFVFACIVTMVSLLIQSRWYEDLFVIPPDFVETTLPNGHKRRTYHHELYRPIWEWYSQHAGKEKSQEKTSVE
ncbi:MAG: hypothetical protein Q8M86_03980 [Syntrophales bacterium]|nr:hypothetical protein [Syntrophales bacterium]